MGTSAVPHATRAFLSHSSLDKAFVEIVARRLGRRRVSFDSWVFESGSNFIAAIRGALASSDCFVLFASRESLESLWIKFEASEAEELTRSQVLKNSIVLIIDRNISPRDCPAWMQRCLIEHVYVPNAAARVTEYQLNRIRGVESEPLFIGREELLREFSENLIPAPESRAPHLLVLGGLPGIGRRTFLSRGAKDFLSLRRGPMFHLRPTDGLDALHFALIGELGELDSKVQVALAIEQFRSATAEEKARILAQLLASTTIGNILPVIVDDGALLDSSGAYVPEALRLFEALKAYPDSVIGILENRRPLIERSQLEALCAIYVRVPHLDMDSTKRLLTQSLRRETIQVSSEQIAELAPYLDGYPPAINLSVAVAKEYGLSTFLADKSGLVDYKIRTFAGVLDKLTLSQHEWDVLRILSAESMPLEGIAACVNAAEEDVARVLHRLVDLNLVLSSGNTFTIALPIKSAVQSIAGRLTDAEYGRIASNLKRIFWDSSDRVPPVEIVEATIHAVVRGGVEELGDFKGFVLPSMLYRAAKECYDRGGQQAWESAQRLILQLLQVDPEHRGGLVIQLKTQVRLSRWSDAERALNLIRSKHMPEQHYLAGFLQWKKGQYAAAVSAFRTGIALGQDSMEVYHGLAYCLFRLENMSEAEKVIAVALKGRRPNSLLLDLAAQIAIAQHSYADAESYIDQLRRVRADADYHHRLATLLNARRKFSEALPHAELALQGPRKRFEVETTFVDTLIEVQNFGRATLLLDELDQRERYANEKKDVRIGLRCKLLLRQKKWRQAEDIWEALVDKSRPVHLALRIEILQQKIADLTVSPGIRAESTVELNKLQTERGTDEMLLFTVDDEPEIGDDENGNAAAGTA
jgi:tetratricopeptide (TPR) repeat protein